MRYFQVKPHLGYCHVSLCDEHYDDLIHQYNLNLCFGYMEFFEDYTTIYFVKTNRTFDTRILPDYLVKKTYNRNPSRLFVHNQIVE